MMLLWSSLAAVLASCWNRLMTCGSVEKSGGRTLIATSRSSVRSWARNTAPMPPLPTSLMISYLPCTSRCSRAWSAATRLVGSAGEAEPAVIGERGVALDALRHRRGDDVLPFDRGSDSPAGGTVGSRCGSRRGRRVTEGASVSCGGAPGGTQPTPLTIQML